MEQLENQLQAWTPCRPSGRLRGRIFGRPTAEAESSRNLAWLRLASSSALILGIAALAFTGLERFRSPSASGGSSTGRALMAVAMSNLNQTAYASNQVKPEWNVPVASFDRTNQGDSTFSPSYPVRVRTNL